MAYELEAFLGAESTVDAAIRDIDQARCVPLAQGVAMIPMTRELSEALQAKYGRPGDDSTSAVAEWAQAASRHGLLAYCEAAYANVLGGQSAILWEDGTEVQRIDDDDSVNQALRLLGVTCEEGLDEWDTVGLGRRRQTERWLDLAKS